MMVSKKCVCSSVARLSWPASTRYCSEWPAGSSLWAYLATATNDPTSALLVSGERSLAAESRPTYKPARCWPRSGAAEHWLAFLGPHLGEIERGRGDRALARIRASWTSWRGRAIEPVIREALERLAPPVITDADGVPGVVGGYWTRTNSPEIDLVVGDRSPVAKQVLALGSIKWLENAPFDHHDLGALHAHRTQLPGAAGDTPLIAVSRAGCTVDGLAHVGPEDLLAGYA